MIVVSGSVNNPEYWYNTYRHEKNDHLCVALEPASRLFPFQPKSINRNSSIGTLDCNLELEPEPTTDC